ncbi:MAG: helix-turn-helix transcriptional regulator [Clostridiales bacterium]|nr:helix-turn-helix transcriptional regulator [Clostridiales bacterium]
MYRDTIFIFYIVAIFLSLLCIALITVVLVNRTYRRNKLYLSTRNFAVTITLTGILYFIFYYREVVQSEFELVMPYRIVDYTLCCTLFLAWMLLIYRMLDDDKYKGIFIFAWILFICRLGASLVIAMGFMGDYYEIADDRVCIIWSATEVVFNVATICLIALYAIYGVRESINRLRKKYIELCSALLIVWSVVQCIVDVGLFFGRFGVSAWALEFPDFTGPIMFLCSLATFVFVFKEDFSPLFFAKRETEPAGDGKEEIACLLDIIAENHKLTVREREVMELVYEGYTNPDIGSMLYISINTVKKHTHNLYEKLDVKSRIELAHLVNAQGNKRQ